MPRGLRIIPNSWTHIRHHYCRFILAPEISSTFKEAESHVTCTNSWTLVVAGPTDQSVQVTTLNRLTAADATWTPRHGTNPAVMDAVTVDSQSGQLCLITSLAKLQVTSQKVLGLNAGWRQP